MHISHIATRFTCSLLLCITPILGNAAPTDPVAALEKIVEACDLVYRGVPVQEVVFMSNINKWVKRLHSPTKISYDVKKTDSLVSPYTGIIEISTLDTAGAFATEAEAEQAVIALGDRGTRRAKDSFTYNYKASSGQWELVGGIFKSEYKLNADKPFERATTGPYPVEAIMDKSKPKIACLSP